MRGFLRTFRKLHIWLLFNAAALALFFAFRGERRVMTAVSERFSMPLERVLGRLWAYAPFSGAEVPDAEVQVKELISGIERGVFWPAADTSEWRWDFADWIFDSPAESVDPTWIADQERRIG